MLTIFFSKIRITLLEMEYLGTESDTMISRHVKTQIKCTLTQKEGQNFPERHDLWKSCFKRATEMLWGGRLEGGSCLGTPVRIKDFKIKKIKN